VRIRIEEWLDSRPAGVKYILFGFEGEQQRAFYVPALILLRVPCVDEDDFGVLVQGRGLRETQERRVAWFA
jgi:hypothetical protein